jgi:hypothetical protein
LGGKTSGDFALERAAVARLRLDELDDLDEPDQSLSEPELPLLFIVFLDDLGINQYTLSLYFFVLNLKTFQFFMSALTKT